MQLHNRAKPMTEIFKKQLEAVIAEHESALSESIHKEASDVLSRTQVTDLQTRCIAAIERIAGRNSPYFRQVKEIGTEKTHPWRQVASLIGVAKALLSDIQNDYLSSLEEILHGDMFSDFLEMAVHLVEKGYKDAAAVLAGSTLEIHIRKLCDKYGVTTTSGKNTKNADTLNADLVKADAYTKLDQKNVTAWLGLRNNAAHGNYSEYTMDQARLFIDSIRDFITRYPA